MLAFRILAFKNNYIYCNMAARINDFKTPLFGCFRDMCSCSCVTLIPCGTICVQIKAVDVVR